MLSLAFAVLLSGLGVPQSGFQASGNDWLLVPGRRAGPIVGTTSEANLRSLFGAENVQSLRVDLGEGRDELGTVIFPTDSTRRLEIRWRDTIQRVNPLVVRLRGDSSQWHFENGVGLGTSLRELERLNGRSFTLTGFGWDYSGALLSWEGGALADLFPLGDLVRLRIDAPRSSLSEADRTAVMGSRARASNGSPLQRLNPRLYFVEIGFSRSLTG